MKMLVRFLIIFSVLTACNSTASGPGKNDPRLKTITDRPFDPDGQLIYTRHARCRMDCRHITAREIHEILDSGNINYEKSEPQGHPDPKFAVEGYTNEGQHLRIIVAPEGHKLIIITCIELGVEWSCDCN
jgi:hypothetical protein